MHYDSENQAALRLECSRCFALSLGLVMLLWDQLYGLFRSILNESRIWVWTLRVDLEYLFGQSLHFFELTQFVKCGYEIGLRSECLRVCLSIRLDLLLNYILEHSPSLFELLQLVQTPSEVALGEQNYWMTALIGLLTPWYHGTPLLLRFSVILLLNEYLDVLVLSAKSLTVVFAKQLFPFSQQC